jgi:hypothetical protein
VFSNDNSRGGRALRRVLGCVIVAAALVPAVAQAADGMPSALWFQPRPAGRPVPVVVRTIGYTAVEPATQACPGYVARVRLGRQAGTRTVLAGTAAISIPEIVPSGVAVFCIHGRVDLMAMFGRTSDYGVLTLKLPGGEIEADLAETLGRRSDGKVVYSASASIRRGSGRYGGITGVIVGRGIVARTAAAGYEDRVLTFRLPVDARAVAGRRPVGSGG